MKTRRMIVAVIISMSLLLQAFTVSPVIDPGPAVSVDAHTPITLVTFTVINNTGGVMYFVMEGKSNLGYDKIYKYNGVLGKNNYKLERGNYVVTFWACDRQVAKLFRITGNRRVTLDCKTNLVVH